MAWSAWQDPATKLITPSRIVLLWDTINGRHTEAAGIDSLYSALDNHASGGEQLSQGGFQFQASASWPTFRDWNPQPLWSLTEGVDYGTIPGKTEYDDDRYVEYETGDNVFAGWDFPSAQTSSWDVYDQPSATLTGKIGLLPNTTYPMTPDTPIVEAFPGVGTEYGAWTQVTPKGSTLPLPPDPGAVETFSILIDIATDGTASVQASYVQPKQRVVLPRWRYWIPDTATVYPLRQKQRNDGLARGVFRARSTSSIQNSVRQNSYR